MLCGTSTMPTVIPAIRSPVNHPKSESTYVEECSLQNESRLLTVTADPLKDGENSFDVVDDLRTS